MNRTVRMEAANISVMPDLKLPSSRTFTSLPRKAFTTRLPWYLLGPPRRTPKAPAKAASGQPELGLGCPGPSPQAVVKADSDLNFRGTAARDTITTESRAGIQLAASSTLADALPSRK